MYLMIDNEDSFVYNLVSYLEEAQIDVMVILEKEMNDDFFKEIRELYNEKKLKGVIISPGPGGPSDKRNVLRFLEEFHKKIPILGVCLGHEIIAYFMGASIIKNTKPKFGKVEEIIHDGTRLFKNLPKRFNVTRYHSLIIDNTAVPEDIIITAKTNSDEIMGIELINQDVFGVQFHPEALLTEYGHEIIENFIEICEQ